MQGTGARLRGIVVVGVVLGVAPGPIPSRAAPAPEVMAPDPEAVAAVAAGTRKEAKASWWGFNADDATAALQAAINSGVRKLIIDNLGRPWVVTPIQLVSNQEIEFEKGVEVLAKADEFKATNAALFSARNVENVVLRGYGATLRMRRADYDDPARYKKAEWRHCLSICSCTNVKVYGLTLTESGGDGIYLGTATQWVTNQGIHIKDVVCDRNYRQGISVITAEDLLIENTVMRETAGTAPQAGIDFEPNHPEERLVNCVMRNCTSEGNGGAGYVLYVRPLNANSVPLSFRFENCVATGNRGTAFGLSTGDTPELAVDGTVDLDACVLASAKVPCLSVSKPAERCRLSLRHCQILGAESEPPQPAPVVIASGQHAEAAVGGIEFADCLIRDSSERSPMFYHDGAGGVMLAGIRGDLTLERAGERSRLSLTPELLAKWLPVTAMRAFPRLKAQTATRQPAAAVVPPEKCAFAATDLRGAGTLLLYAKADEVVTFCVRHRQVGRYAGQPAPIVITGPNGEKVARAEAAFQAESEVSFKAPVTGVYRVAGDARANRWGVIRSTHPLNLVGETGPVHLIQSAGDFYFRVPKGTTAFGARVAGEGAGEAIRALLLNSKGEVVQEVDNAAQVHQFEVALDPPSAGETWCLRLARPTTVTWEDHYVDLRGVPPLLAPSPEALLVAAE